MKPDSGSAESVLSIRQLRTRFNGGTPLTVVDGVSLDIRRNSTFALVGESGSGKSVTALSVIRLLPETARITDGQVLMGSEDLLRIPESSMCAVRGRRIAMVFQDPMTSLNPVVSIGDQIAESVARHTGLKGQALRRRVLELMDQVEIPSAARRYADYPHQLSGGQRQRIVIAIALAGSPEVLIADEPTTALDVTIQAQILNLLKQLQQNTGMALWLITHDFGIVEQIADTVAVMREGRIVESSSQQKLFEDPQHEYTRRLFSVLPSIRNFRPATGDQLPPLLSVQGLQVHYPVRKGVFRRVVDHVKAVDGIDMELPAGRTLALVGESGCGKTTLGKALINLVPTTAGQVLFDGRELGTLGREDLRLKRAEMQMVFQDPFSSMNPRMLVGEIIEEGLRSLRTDLSTAERIAKVEFLLSQVGLPATARQRYPHEFSGGQRQRICIARALAVEPKLIICDEPTSALDVSVQAQILDLLRSLQQEKGLGFLFISHDLAVVAEMAHYVAVMYQGRIIEYGPTAQVLASPREDYTRNLLQAVPQLNIRVPGASR